MPAFRPTDPFQDFVAEAVVRINIPVNECKGCLWGRAQGDITFGEGVRRMATEPAFRLSWLVWVLWKMSDLLPSAVRASFINRIAANSMSAYRAYLGLGDLTPAEENRLANAFAGKLPAIERQLAAGQLVRVKDGGEQLL